MVAQLRADRIALSPPRTLGDGSVVYEAVLARADALLVYEWGTEVATEDALSSPEYLAGLRGISLTTLRTARHVNGGAPVSVRSDARAVGAVLDARWDAEDRAVVVEIAVNDAETLAAIERGEIRELSEQYLPTTRTRADGVIEQMSRTTNTIAIVRRGRMPGAIIRADGDDMTEDEIRRIVQEAIAAGLRADADQSAALDAEKTRADEAEAKLAALRATVGLRADSDDVDGAIATLIDERTRADAALLERARELGVKLPDESTPATRRKDLAILLGGDKTRADSADYCDGVIHAARPADVQTAAGVPTAHRLT